MQEDLDKLLSTDRVKKDPSSKKPSEKPSQAVLPLSYTQAVYLLGNAPEQLKSAVVYYPFQLSDDGDRFEWIFQETPKKLSENYWVRFEIHPAVDTLERNQVISYELGLWALEFCPERLQGKSIDLKLSGKANPQIFQQVLQLRRYGAVVSLSKQESIELSKTEETLSIEIPEELRCPITQKLMLDPVIVVESGETYEREAIKNWLKNNDTDYVTKEKLDSKALAPNKAIKNMLIKFLEKQQHLKGSQEVYRSEQAKQDFIEALAKGEVESLEKLSKQHSWLLTESEQYESYFQKASEHQKPENLAWLIKTLGAGLLELKALSDGSKNWLEQQLKTKPSAWLNEVAKAIGLGASEQLPILQKQLKEKQQEIEKLQESLKHGGEVGKEQKQQLELLQQNANTLSQKIQELNRSIQQKDQKINQLQQENQRRQTSLDQLKRSHQQETERLSELNKTLSKKIEKYKPVYNQHKPQKLNLSFFSDIKPSDLNYKKKFKTTVEAVDYFSEEVKRQKNYNPKDLEALMKDVMEGNLDGVANRLKENPELMQCQMKFKDYAGREFPKITPFQLAVWYGDWHMWELMRDQKEIKYPLNDKQAAIQYHALKQNSQEVSGENGAKYSFKILLEAYAKTERLYKESKYDECNKCFVKEVGGAQRSVPYWYQYLMSEAGECDWTRQQITENSGKKGGKGRVKDNISSERMGEIGIRHRTLSRGDRWDISYIPPKYPLMIIMSDYHRRLKIDSSACTICEQIVNQTESKLEKSLPLNTLQLSIEQNPKGVESYSNVIQFN